MTDEEKWFELNRLVRYLEHEKRNLNSCVPDLVERIQNAIDEHCVYNMEHLPNWDNKEW